MEQKIYDLAILGGGPAGVAAGVYAARKQIKTILITKSFESQSTVSENIQNWIGTVSISGQDLSKNLEKHLRNYSGEYLDVHEKESILNLEKEGEIFKVKTNKGEYSAKTVLVTSGSIRKKIFVKGAEEFENRGITYCATCDGPLFADMDVVVIGGGNAAFESAAQLASYTKSVTILARTGFRADAVTVEKVLADQKVKAVKNTELIEIKGDKFVTAIVYKDNDSNEVIELPVSGVFVEIGSNPSVEYLKNGIVKLTDHDQVVVDPMTQRTSTLGIWAAGDCTDGLYHQNNIAVGDAIKALENIYYFLKI